MDERKKIEELVRPLRVEPGRKVELAKDYDPGDRAGFVHKKDATQVLERGVELLSEYQARLAAQDTDGVLVVLQAIDAGGKDGTIAHVTSGVNPQGVKVHSFKAPSDEELSHDFLWRCVERLPARGEIGIFNRSHYEEVLVVRVHPEFLGKQKLPPEDVGDHLWQHRYRSINDWERHLVDSGFRVVKLFLNISREEQRVRFLKRLEDPAKNWKFKSADVAERDHWDEYQQAYSEMLSQTSTEWAPWYVIPGDHKWFARIAAASVIVRELMDIDPQWPTFDDAAKAEFARMKAVLESQAPSDAEPDPATEPKAV
ncbi:MAG TPA: polyphosphate kinase 2 family protein [Gaiellaceae bacterium]|jgi:PPK2 family polyphosphate:nucleotide phosphotransferase|nr:polyphosphate kinase 2 family protein [Gaiellaceae bacterium]